MRALKPRARARLFARFKAGESFDDLRIAYQLPLREIETIVRVVATGQDRSACGFARRITGAACRPETMTELRRRI